MDIDVEYSVKNTSHYNNGTQSTEEGAWTIVRDSPSFDWYIDSTAITDSLVSSEYSYETILDVIKEVYCRWETKTGIDFKFKGNNSNGQSYVDNKFTITIDTEAQANDFLMATYLDKKYSCVIGRHPIVTDHIYEGDIAINTKYDWFISNGNDFFNIGSSQFDFYSVLLHEIGHQIGLDHAKDMYYNETFDDRLMYYVSDSAEINRVIDPKTENGGDKQVELGLSVKGICYTGSPYSLDVESEDCDGTTPINNYIAESNKSIIYPNPVFNTIIIEGLETPTYIVIYNTNGNELLTRKTINKKVEIDVSNIGQGIFFVKLLSKNGDSIIRKLVKI